MSKPGLNPLEIVRDHAIASQSRQLSLPTRAAVEKTLAEAIHEVRSKVVEGSRCPCCNRLVKLYKRKLSAEMVVFLIALCWEYAGDYLDIRKLRKWKYQRGDYAYLAHWGLVEQKEGNEDGKRGSAHWRPTDAAFKFIFRHALMPSHIHMLCGEYLGHSEKLVSVDDALGEKFNYDELIRGVEQ